MGINSFEITEFGVKFNKSELCDQWVLSVGKRELIVLRLICNVFAGRLSLFTSRNFCHVYILQMHQLKLTNLVDGQAMSC